MRYDKTGVVHSWWNTNSYHIQRTLNWSLMMIFVPPTPGQCTFECPVSWLFHVCVHLSVILSCGLERRVGACWCSSCTNVTAGACIYVCCCTCIFVRTCWNFRQSGDKTSRPLGSRCLHLNPFRSASGISDIQLLNMHVDERPYQLPGDVCVWGVYSGGGRKDLIEHERQQMTSGASALPPIKHLPAWGSRTTEYHGL